MDVNADLGESFVAAAMVIQADLWKLGSSGQWATACASAR
jgi:hypothetical protein